MSRLALRPLPLVLRDLEVAAVEDVTPRLRRITLTGAQLSSFSLDSAATGPGGGDIVQLPAFSAPGFDDHVKCIFTGDGGEAALPIQLPHGIEWPPADGRVTRDYTPTRFDAEAQELDLEFVLHGHGPAASWARDAVVGARLNIVGPKMTLTLPSDLDWIVLAGDETAIPAITRFARERPTAARAIMTIVTDDVSAQVPIETREGDVVRWIVGDPTDGAALRDAVADTFPETGSGYAWAAGESRALLPLRRLFKASGCLDKSRINVTGYWTQTAEADDPASASAGSHAPAAPAEAPRELPPSPVAWLAIRAALSVGLFAAMGEHARTATDLAVGTGTALGALRLVLDALVAENVLRISGDTDTDTDGEPLFALDALGETLLDDDHVSEQFLGHHADEALALLGLGESLRGRGGATAWKLQHGATLLGGAEADPEVFEEITEGAGGLAYFSSAIAADPAVSSAAHTILLGPGATTCAEVLTEQLGAGCSVTVTEQPAFLEVLRDAAAKPSSLDFVPLAQLPTPADGATIVSALALGMRSDEEARDYLAELRHLGDQLVLVERFSQDALNPRADESALIDFGKTGRVVAGAEVFDALAHPHWVWAREFELGWGMRAVVYSASR